MYLVVFSLFLCVFVSAIAHKETAVTKVVANENKVPAKPESKDVKSSQVVKTEDSPDLASRYLSAKGEKQQDFHSRQSLTNFKSQNTQQSSSYGSSSHNSQQSSGYGSPPYNIQQSSGYGSLSHNTQQASGYGSLPHNTQQSLGYGSPLHNAQQSSGYGSSSLDRSSFDRQPSSSQFSGSSYSSSSPQSNNPSSYSTNLAPPYSANMPNSYSAHLSSPSYSSPSGDWSPPGGSGSTDSNNDALAPGCKVDSRFLKVGDKWSEPGICGLFVCQQNTFRTLITKCPEVIYQEGSECYVAAQEMSKEYPECCPKLICSNTDKRPRTNEDPNATTESLFKFNY